MPVECTSYVEQLQGLASLVVMLITGLAVWLMYDSQRLNEQRCSIHGCPSVECRARHTQKG